MSRHAALTAPARRMLSAEEAAAYCGGRSVAWLESHVKVAPVMIGRLKRYDVRALDIWLDGLGNGGAARGQPATGDDWLEKLRGEADGEGT